MPDEACRLATVETDLRLLRKELNDSADQERRKSDQIFEKLEHLEVHIIELQSDKRAATSFIGGVMFVCTGLGAMIAILIQNFKFH